MRDIVSCGIANELSLYVNDVLIATKTDPMDPTPIEDRRRTFGDCSRRRCDFLDAEITYDPNVVQLHDIAVDANLPESTIAMLRLRSHQKPFRYRPGIMTTPALNDARYVLGSLEGDNRCSR